MPRETTGSIARAKPTYAAKDARNGRSSPSQSLAALPDGTIPRRDATTVLLELQSQPPQDITATGPAGAGEIPLFRDKAPPGRRQRSVALPVQPTSLARQ